MPAKGRHAQYRRGALLTPSNFSSTIIELITQNPYQAHRPFLAFITTSWVALLTDFLVFLIGLFNASIQLDERGHYFAVFIHDLFAAVLIQKGVRSRFEGISVAGIYYGLGWVSVLLVVLFLCTGLFNAILALSGEDFHGMSFALTSFGIIAV